MYPRYNFITGERFLCKLVVIDSAQFVQIHVPLTLGDLHAGMSVAIMQYTGPVRGKLVYVDDDGYCDVWLIDEGIRIYSYLMHMYHPHPLCITVAALCV